MPTCLHLEKICMPKNILITGSNGQLGQELQSLVEKQEHELSGANFYFTDRDSLDITNKKDLQNFIETNTIDTIINCAAYTAVDKAEKDQKTANDINHLAVKHMAEIAKQKAIQLIHISTDYVFDGSNHQPYKEEDPVNPQGVYGKTKLDGENSMIAINPLNSIIIRTSWVYSSFGSNFVKTMLRLGKEKDELGVIFDQVGTPTYARDLAEAILHFVLNNTKEEQDLVQIYHYSNEGVCSWYDFSKAIFEFANISCNVNPIRTEQYPTPAKRPHYSILNKEKIKKTFNIQIPYWRDSLESSIQTLKDKGKI